MAQLPDFEALGERATPVADVSVARPQPSNIRMAGIQGSLVREAGGELQQAGDAIQAGNLKMDTIAAEAAVTKATQARLALEFDPDTGFRNAQGQAATSPQFQKDFTDRFANQVSGISDGLDNDQQRQIFNRNVQVQTTQFQSSLLSHVAQQSDKFVEEAYTGKRQTLLADIASHPMDEAGFQANLAQLSGNTDLMNAHKHLPQQYVDMLKQQDLSAAWSSRVLAVNETDPRTAKQMMTDHASELGEAFPKLSREVDAAVKTVDGRDGAHAIMATAPQDPMKLEQAVPGLLDKATALADKLHPNDPVFADGMRSRVMSYVGITMAGFRAQQASDRDALLGGIVSDQGRDGSPKTFDEFIAKPGMQDVWNRADNATKLSIQDHFKAAAADGVPRSQATQDLRAQLVGEAITSPETFNARSTSDWLPILHQLPFSDQDFIMGLRQRSATKDEQEMAKQANVTQALKWADENAIVTKPPNLDKLPPDNPQRVAYNQFAGALSDQMTAFQQAHGKLPGQQDTLQIIRNLAAPVSLPGRLYGTNTKPLYALTDEEQGRPGVTTQMSPAERQEMTQGFVKRYGTQPTESELQSLRIAKMLHANDPAMLLSIDQTLRQATASRRAHDQAVQSIPK